MNIKNQVIMFPAQKDRIMECKESLFQSMWELQRLAETAGKKDLLWFTLNEFSTLAGLMMLEGDKEK